MEIILALLISASKLPDVAPKFNILAFIFPHSKLPEVVSIFMLSTLKLPIVIAPEVVPIFILPAFILPIVIVPDVVVISKLLQFILSATKIQLVPTIDISWHFGYLIVKFLSLALTLSFLPDCQNLTYNVPLSMY